MLKAYLLCDVRSPSEFKSGHIPGAINIPLFNDKEREAVGIKYKKEGRIPAILEGLKLSAPMMSDKLVSGTVQQQKTENFWYIAGEEE